MKINVKTSGTIYNPGIMYKYNKLSFFVTPLIIYIIKHNTMDNKNLNTPLC